MDLSYFLAKYFGVYMIIAGLWMIVRRDHLRAVVQNMVDNPALVMFSGALAFLMGWLVVLIHPVWIMDWKGAITLLFGVLPMAKGIIRMFFFDQVRPWIERFVMGHGPLIEAIITILLGAYFAYMGFLPPSYAYALLSKE